MTRIEAPQHLPSVDRLVNTPAVQKFVRDYGLALVTRCTQGILTRVRLMVLAGESTDMAALIQLLSDEIEHILLPSLRPVYNLTGTVLHTNLGRAHCLNPRYKRWWMFRVAQVTWNLIWKRANAVIGIGMPKLCCAS